MLEPIPQSTLSRDLVAAAAKHLGDVLRLAFEHGRDAAALVVWDRNSELALALASAYRTCLPGATFREFDETQPNLILEEFDRLGPGDLVVLVQSTSFRLDALRIRIELFRRSLKVIEHPHLARMAGEQAATYVQALAYDADYYRGIGHGLKAHLDGAQECVLESGGAQLHFPAGLEPAKLNIGDYTGMRNIGGQYPIGEVFTESRDLEAVHGRVRIAFFGDTSFTVNRPAHPITLVVEQGRVVSAEDSTTEFDSVLAQIQQDEGQVWLRELGLGMNRALGPDRTVRDIGTFERMCGVHLSLGAKHAVYNKANIRKKSARYHVDVFADTVSVLVDGRAIYQDGEWTP